MARTLKDLLDSDHPLFAMNIARLEKASGSSGIDTRLVGEIFEQGFQSLRMLGLDPSDSTSHEVYMALRAAASRPDLEQVFAVPYALVNFGDGPVSLNPHDIVENAHHELAFDDRSVAHGQRALRCELIRRYAEHDRTSNSLVHELTRDMGVHTDEDQGYAIYETPDETPTTDKRPRVLMIGDIFTDAFIKLPEGTAKIIKEDDGKEWLALPFGQKPPYESVDIVRSVGPSPNAAVSASRLGLDAHLMAWVGDDQVGVEAIDHLKNEAVGTTSMVAEAGKATSYWYVLRYGADRTMLVKSEQYAYEWSDPEVVPDWIYLSYIGVDSWPLHEALLDYLERHPSVKLAFQPGTFHFQWGVEKLAGLYGRSEIVVMNREEAVEVTGRDYENLHDLAAGLHDLGPAIAVITDGPHGSYASYDGRLVTIPNYPDPAPPLDRTGAGDAFASTIVASLALGRSMDEALRWAPINSMSVVQKMGAQAGLLHAEDFAQYLREAPENYNVTEINK